VRALAAAMLKRARRGGYMRWRRRVVCRDIVVDMCVLGWRKKLDLCALS
jgi:hypothetical protein